VSSESVNEISLSKRLYKNANACGINVLELDSVDKNGVMISCTGKSYYSFVCVDKNNNPEGCIHMTRNGESREVYAYNFKILNNVKIGSYYDRDACVDKMVSFEKEGFVCDWISGNMNCRVCVNGDKEWWNFDHLSN